MPLVYSPVSYSENTSQIDNFQSADIITLYRIQLDMDVSNYFLNNPEFQLFQCKDTGYRFYHPQGLDGDGTFYATLQNRLGDDYYHPWKFENQLAFESINADDKVLDIGCGIGNFLVRAREKTKEVYGLELNDKAVGECLKRGLNVRGEMIQEHAKTHKEFYDVVCLFQVLEHIYDVRGFLDASLSVLKKNGKLIIGVPNNEPWFKGHDKYCTLNLPPHHMGLWNKKVFENIAPIFNLSLIKTVYDERGNIKTDAYLRAKFMAGVKSLPARHSSWEKIKIVVTGLFALPLSIMQKTIKGINGSHIAVLFIKR